MREHFIPPRPAKEYDPKTRLALGKFPQAYSHIGLINCALLLDGAPRWRRRVLTRAGAHRSHSPATGPFEIRRRVVTIGTKIWRWSPP
jgi:hypothetical protein